MKNELQQMTEDISKLYTDINDKTNSLGPIVQITKLYDELQGHLHGISLDDIDQCADLLCEFVLGIEAEGDFTPR